MLKLHINKDVDAVTEQKYKSIDQEKIILTYPQFRNSIREISRNIIIRDNYQADAILCIARGGLLVGAQLAYDLGIKQIGSINIEYYTNENTCLETPIILEPTINLNEFLHQKHFYA